MKKNHFYYRRTGATWTDPFHTPADRLHLTNFRPDLDHAHNLHVERQLKKYHQELAEDKLRLLEMQERVRSTFQRQYDRNRQIHASDARSIRISGRTSRRCRKVKSTRPAHDDIPAQTRFEIDSFEQRILSHNAANNGNPWRPGYDYTV